MSFDEAGEQLAAAYGRGVVALSSCLVAVADANRLDTCIVNASGRDSKVHMHIVHFLNGRIVASIMGVIQDGETAIGAPEKSEAEKLYTAAMKELAGIHGPGTPSSGKETKVKWSLNDRSLSVWRYGEADVYFSLAKLAPGETMPWPAALRGGSQGTALLWANLDPKTNARMALTILGGAAEHSRTVGISSGGSVQTQAPVKGSLLEQISRMPLGTNIIDVGSRLAAAYGSDVVNVVSCALGAISATKLEVCTVNRGVTSFMGTIRPVTHTLIFADSKLVGQTTSLPQFEKDGPTTKQQFAELSNELALQYGPSSPNKVMGDEVKVWRNQKITVIAMEGSNLVGLMDYDSSFFEAHSISKLMDAIQNTSKPWAALIGWGSQGAQTR